MVMQYENRGTKPKLATLSEIVRLTGISKDILYNTKIDPKDVPEISSETLLSLEYYQSDQNETFDDTNDLLKAKPARNSKNIAQKGEYISQKPVVEQKLNSNSTDYGPTKIGGGIPMYNVPASASDIEMYQDESDVKIIGYLNMPGAVIGSFSLPVHGHSMYPTLENGNWCVVRPIKEPSDIDWGEIYFIQYGDYRVFKRLLKADNPDTVILWSDNQSEVIMGRPKYAAKNIKLDRIKKLCIVTDILKKPNY